MTKKMGVREFRENFTTIARDATEPVIVTNHDKVVGWFTPAKREPGSIDDFIKHATEFRARLEARGIDVAARMKELGLEDGELFDDPWVQGQPANARKKAPKRKRK